MKDTKYLRRQRAVSEETINSKQSDFTAKYFAVHHLRTLAETEPGIIRPETISALERLLKDTEFSHRRQGFFLLREAAETLVSVITHSNGNGLADPARSSLGNLLCSTTGYAHRATAEALGTLPFSARPPDGRDTPTDHAPKTRWQKILDEKGFELVSPPVFVGRSLVAELGQENKLLVLKIARADDVPESLSRESFWMEHLASEAYAFPMRFNIPETIKIRDSHLFRLRNIPVKALEHLRLHPEKYAIAFVAHKEYFVYPNDSKENGWSADTAFSEVMSRNAWLLGKLAGLGIVHSALIPLFHNRVQRERRRDHGFYEWFRGGRLDRWLGSCEYPNLGVTGIRDFEHFVCFDGSNQNLYRHLGSHFLSLLLVAGSYFRNKDKSRHGLDALGMPIDARDLFDKQIFKEIVRRVFLSYYDGFVGTEFRGGLPFDLDALIFRMIQEMGVDRYMEETLRAADQERMSEHAFRSFLSERGYPDQDMDGIRKGAEDIVICTGPHLGGFNQKISVPEMIEAVEAMAASCIAGRYFRDKIS